MTEQSHDDAASQPNPHAATGLKTLSELGIGTRGIVRRLAGGHGLIGRLVALGFTVGAETSVVQNYGHGPVIVAVRDTRVALGRGEAAKIWVEIIGESIETGNG